MKAVAPLERGCRAGLGAVRGDQRGVQVDDNPPGQDLPGHIQPREPAGAQRQQTPHMPADHRPGLGDPGQAGLVDPVQGPAGRGVRRRVTEHPRLMGQQLDVGQAHRPERDRDRQVDQNHTTIPPPGPFARREQRTERGGQPHPVGAPTQQHRASVSDQTLRARLEITFTDWGSGSSSVASLVGSCSSIRRGTCGVVFGGRRVPGR